MKNFKIMEHVEFGKVRTLIDKKGNILFCGRDVVNSLGYSNTKDALTRHCRCVVKHYTPHPQNPNKKMRCFI